MWRFTLSLLVLSAICVKTQVEQSKSEKIQVENTPKLSIPSLNITAIPNNKTITPATQKAAKNATNKPQTILVDGRTLTEPALYRLFYVLLGLSTITICYVVFRLYRVRNGATRPTAVRKYGVLAQRSDIEMEPLHLDDEDDDDTVFDRGAQANR